MNGFSGLWLALIGGGVSIVSLVITQQLKISEFRLKWIEDFRNELGIFLGNIETLSKLAKPYIVEKHKENLSKDDIKHYPLNSFDLKDFRNKHRLLYTPLDQTKNFILLRLYDEKKGKKDPEFDCLKESINNLNKHFFENSCTIANCDTATIYINQVRDRSEKVLQREWRKVWSGERFFKITKVVTIFLCLIIISYIFYLFWTNKLPCPPVSK